MTSPDFSVAIRPEGEGAICIDVYCEPGSSRPSVGPYDPWRRRFHVKVSAPAVGGRANKELAEVVGDVLGLPASQVTIVRGATTRRKTLRVSGIGAEAAAATLAKALE